MSRLPSVADRGRAFLQGRLGFLLFANAAVAILMSQLSPYFFTSSNAQALLQYGAVLSLLALGQTLVIISGGGGIDLSVGAMLSLVGVAFGSLVVQHEAPLVVAAFAAIAVGAALGAFNGILVTLMRMPPIIATLGTLYLYSSIALIVTNAAPLSGFPSGFARLGQSFTFGIPNQFLFAVLPMVLILGIVVRATLFGRAVYLVGVNELAARLAGINVIQTRIAVYSLSGVLAALGALVTASWLMSARPDAGVNYELQSITVAVLGGAYIFGGEGTLTGGLLAVLLVTMVASGLSLAEVDPTWQLGILGVLLIVTVSLNELFTQRTGSVMHHQSEGTPLRPAGDQ